MWFDPGLAGLFITLTLLHLGEEINILVVSLHHQQPHCELSVGPPASSTSSNLGKLLHPFPLVVFSSYTSCRRKLRWAGPVSSKPNLDGWAGSNPNKKIMK